MTREPRSDTTSDPLVESFMNRVSNAPRSVPPLPDPRAIWAKARLQREWDTRRRALAPLAQMDAVQVAVGVAATVFLLVRALPVIWPAMRWP